MEIRHETECRVLLSCPRVQRSHVCVLYFRHHRYIEKRKRSTDGTLSEWCEKEQNNTININICETRFLNFSSMVFTFYRSQNFFFDINYVLNIILHDRYKYRKFPPTRWKINNRNGKSICRTTAEKAVAFVCTITYN